MNYKTYGNINNEKILIISPIFEEDDVFKKILQYYKDYFVIIPELDKRDNIFTSFEKDTDDIYKILRDNDIKDLRLMLTFSYGGNIALNLLSRNILTVRKIVMDGVIIQPHNVIVRKIIKLKIKEFKRDFLNGTFKKSHVDKKFPGMYDIFLKIVKNTDDKSLENLVEESTKYKFPKIKEKCLFIFGESDPNLKNINILKKNYSSSDFITIDRMTHVNYIFKDTFGFLKLTINS